MTRKTTVCPNLKWTLDESSREPFDYGYVDKETWSCKYKGFTFVYKKRRYHEYSTEDCREYDECSEAMYCTDTGDLVGEDWACNDYAVVNYVKGLTKKQHTKDVLVKMLMKTDLISYYGNCKYNNYNYETKTFNEDMNKLSWKEKNKLFKKELQSLPLAKLYDYAQRINMPKTMKRCSGDTVFANGKKGWIGFCFNEGRTVLGRDGNVYAGDVYGQSIVDGEWDGDLECDIHSPFYLLYHYAGMKF